METNANLMKMLQCLIELVITTTMSIPQDGAQVTPIHLLTFLNTIFHTYVTHEIMIIHMIESVASNVSISQTLAFWKPRKSWLFSNHEITI